MKRHLHSVCCKEQKPPCPHWCLTCSNPFTLSLPGFAVLYHLWMLHSSAHQRSASSTSHDSGYVSGSTSASAPTALTGASSCSPNHSRLSTDTSRLLSSKLFKGWVRTYDPVERCGIIQARTGTTYELDGADVVSPVDRSHVREGLAVSFEARLEQGAFRAEAIQVTWPVVGCFLVLSTQVRG